MRIITRNYEVKKAIILTSISLVIVASATTTALALRSNTPEKVAAQTTVSAPVSEPQVTEPVTEPTPPTEAPQKASNEVTIPSNEDLIAQYGWTSGSDRESIDLIISLFPQWFTDKERVIAFDYLNKAATSNVVVGSEPKTINSISMVKWFLQSNYQPVTWRDLGTLTNVDNSYYSWVQ